MYRVTVFHKLSFPSELRFSFCGSLRVSKGFLVHRCVCVWIQTSIQLSRIPCFVFCALLGELFCSTCIPFVCGVGNAHLCWCLSVSVVVHVSME